MIPTLNRENLNAKIKAQTILKLYYSNEYFFIGLIGCTQPIRQSADLSQSGIKYSDAMMDLLDVTKDTVIGSDSNDLLSIQKDYSENDKAKESSYLEGRLNERNNEVKDLIEELGSFQDYTRQLKDYFVSLQALASSNAPETATIVITELSCSK